MQTLTRGFSGNSRNWPLAGSSLPRRRYRTSQVELRRRRSWLVASGDAARHWSAIWGASSIDRERPIRRGWPSRLGIAARHHDGDEVCLFLRRQRRWTAVAPAIGKALEAILIVTHDPVAQRLAIHLGRLGRLLAAHARKRIGDGQDGACYARVRLGLGQLAQHDN